MTDNVTTITPVRATLDANQQLITMLEQLLEKARAGEMRGAAVAYVLRDDLSEDGSVDNAWAAGNTWALDRAIRGLVYSWEHTQFEFYRR